MTTSTTQTIEQAVAALFEAYDYQRVTVAFIIAQGRVAADQACVLMTAKLATMPDDMRAEWKATGPLQQLRNACRRLNLNWSFTSSKKGPILTCDRAITAIVQPAAKPPVSPDSKVSGTTSPTSAPSASSSVDPESETSAPSASSSVDPESETSAPSASSSVDPESETIRELRAMLSATQAELDETSAKLATANNEIGILITKLSNMRTRAESAEQALTDAHVSYNSAMLRAERAESALSDAFKPEPVILSGKRNKREQARAHA